MDDLSLPKEPSKFVQDTIDYNSEDIFRAARMSALQAMPICLAQGLQTTLQKQTELIEDAIQDLVRKAIDEGEICATNMVGIYKIDINLGEHVGEGISDKEKNVFQLDIEISIALEWVNVQFHPDHYAKGKRIAKKWFGRTKSE